jgi:signal transduction histidine kinase
MLLANLLIFIAACLLLVLGLIIIAANPKKLQNQTLAAFQIGAFVWLITNLITNISENPQTSLYFARFALVGAVIMMVSIVLFALEFSDIDLTKVKVTGLLVIPLILLISVPTEYNIKSIDAGGENLKTGPIYILLILFVLTYSLLAVYLFWRTYKKSKRDNEKKAQLRYIITGAIFTFIPALLFSAVLPVLGFPNAAFYGPLAIVALALSTTIAIVKHKFLNVRLLAARSAAYFFSVAVIVVLYAVIAFTFARSISALSVTLNQAIFFAIFSALTALIFQPIKRFFDKFSNSIFYRDAYDGQEFLNSVNARIVKSNDLYKLLTDIAEEVKTTIKVNNVSFYIDSSAAIDFHTAGTNTSLFAHTEWVEVLNEFNELDKKVISADSLEIDAKTQQKMRKINIELVIKMTSKDENVGYLLLSERKSGTNFGLQDIQVLEILADELAITVQNAVQLEQIAQFNVTLQKKINNATTELQQSNEKLVKLDEAKDEFISMASHQLRTPLTSVKGYISMILEGDAGEINETQKKFLDQAYISSQRMVYLIADLLNVSRLKTGKFVIEKAPTYLPDVIESEVSQLYGTAEARDLKLIFHKPKEFPMIDLDETKIRQVIMNFADNAIYYTPHGGKITIELKKLKNSIEYTVTDTGIGVPKAEQHHLFNKFYRAANAKKARPDGTGLGLYMAKKVVVAQGGAIIFKTTEGKGSTFGFSFPLPKDGVQEDPQSEETETTE